MYKIAELQQKFEDLSKTLYRYAHLYIEQKGAPILLHESVSNVFYDSKNRKSTDLVLRYYRINNDQLEFLKKQFKTKKVMFSW